MFCTDHCGAGSSDREHCSIKGSQNTSQCEPQADAVFGNRAAVSDWKCKRFFLHTLMDLPTFEHITHVYFLPCLTESIFGRSSS